MLERVWGKGGLSYIAGGNVNWCSHMENSMQTPEEAENNAHMVQQSFQVALVVKNPPANAGDARDVGSTPELKRSPGVGNSTPLQYSCLKKLHGKRSLAGYNPWGCKESDTAEHAHKYGAATPVLRVHPEKTLT